MEPAFWGEGEVVGGQQWHIPLERAMVVSYRLSIVTVSLSVTIWPQFAIEMSPTLKSTGWVTLGPNFLLLQLPLE